MRSAVRTFVQLQQGGHVDIRGVLIMAVKNVVNKWNSLKCLLDGLGRRDLRPEVVEDDLGQLGAGDLVRPIGRLVKGSLRHKSLGRVTLDSDFNFI